MQVAQVSLAGPVHGTFNSNVHVIFISRILNEKLEESLRLVHFLCKGFL